MDRSCAGVNLPSRRAGQSAAWFKEVRNMIEAVMTYIVGIIALSAILGVFYKSLYVDRE
jgi:hypothetical protein